LTGLRATQIPGKTLFLGVSTKVFLEDISYELVDYLKKVFFYPCGQASFNLLCVQMELKKNRKGTDKILPSWFSFALEH
jgi:hypothetical protein